MKDGLYQVTTNYLCAGFEIKNGGVIACAPILRGRIAYWKTVAKKINKRMKVGFTGTQHGMTNRQKIALTNLLTQLKPEWFHHGDCIGADEEAHEIAISLGIKIAIHPPTLANKRAFCEGYKKKFPKRDYLDRNQDIVDSTDLLIGTPKTVEEELRSGTWATMRYAWRQARPVRVLEP